jgi:hypothetical protein
MNLDDLNKKPVISFEQAKDAILDELRTEETRHESVISVEIARYEAIVRLENEYNERRVAELNGLIARINEHLGKDAK